MEVKTKFNIGQTVRIHELDTKAVVRSAHIFAAGIQYDVGWFNNGTYQSAYLFEDQLRSNSETP